MRGKKVITLKTQGIGWINIYMLEKKKLINKYIDYLLSYIRQ